ncbi:transmembrane protein 254 [Genypterus blacodes]|uniref:transmembrane protein 254 n=1 Tax=Genypterus blacodes TaxID=154954 RepID=UPI003F75CFE2
MAKSDGCDYFRRTSLFWMVAVTLSMTYFTFTVFAPGKIPYKSLGQFGTFSKHLVDNYPGLLWKGWFAAWAVHAFEASIAMKMCRQKGITDGPTRFLWLVQTVLFGFASLGLLLKYDPERPKQH